MMGWDDDDSFAVINLALDGLDAQARARRCVELIKAEADELYSIAERDVSRECKNKADGMEYALNTIQREFGIEEEK